MDCDSLEMINLPNNLISIEEGAFSGAKNTLKTIYYNGSLSDAEIRKAVLESDTDNEAITIVRS